ncbi:MAG: 2Fe-2S iron-sulfur cluster-binding protein, partial [Endozoicomonas sp.]
DGLLKRKGNLPFSCKAGVCHSCLMQVTNGNPPAGSQNFLTEQQVLKGYLLACQTTVKRDLALRLPQRDEVTGIITGLEQVNATEITLRLSTRLPFSIAVGDTFYIINHEGLEGCYEIAFISDDLLNMECQVERQAGGDPFSVWIHSEAHTGLRLMLIRS